MVGACLDLNIKACFHSIFFSYSPSFDIQNKHQDERGNLKAVNLVIRHPCKIFFFILFFCLALSFLLNVLVFRTSESGNPFTPPSNEFDLNDVRSIQYDSLRLAKDEVSAGRKIVDMEGELVKKQSESSAM